MMFDYFPLQRGEMLLAMEDYAAASKLEPSRTDSLLKHGLHYFKNQCGLLILYKPRTVLNCIIFEMFCGLI